MVEEGHGVCAAVMSLETLLCTDAQYLLPLPCLFCLLGEPGEVAV